ncbi:MAG: hypothetical protein O7D91_02505 [Planctomycetota bacterium]|nr:hypothetical protein [Planctomycetota bacterium]
MGRRVDRNSFGLEESRKLNTRDDSFDDREWPDRQDCTPEDAEPDEIPCPNCHHLIYEEAEQCPHCGEWVVRPSFSRGAVWGVLAVLVILAFLLAFVF